MTDAPTELGENARRLWEATTEKYDLEVHELLVLEQACRELDLVESMESQIAQLGDDYMTLGSMGQSVINDLVKEIRQHRAKFEQSLRALNLPSDDAGANPRSTQAREAAKARWRRAS